MAIDLNKSTHRQLELNRSQLMNLMLTTTIEWDSLHTKEGCHSLAQDNESGRRVDVSVYRYTYDCYECRLKISYTATPVSKH